ncbi:FlgD immunoglobulin-like domain containing protein [Streptomyces fradiae]|uniref:FlgD immunoglobulin-like domain containing protein n=1 Tax=Streptomyces fradiae TaxID=1906 RepID=UPI0035163155
MSRTAPARRTRTRAALVLALTTVTAATSAGITAPPAVADTAPQTTVLPAAPRFSPRATSILNAGQTGYLLAQEDDTRLQWIDYATGTATPLAVALPEAPRYDYENGYWDWRQGLHIADGAHWGHGSDTVAVYSAAPTPHVTLQKGAGAVFADIVIPEGQVYVGTYGDTVLTSTGEANAPTGFHLLRAGAEKVTDTPVTGLPEGAVPTGVEDGDARSLVLRYKNSTEGWGNWALVDLADGTAETLPEPQDDPFEVNGFRLGAGTILRLRTGRSKIDVLDRAAPGTPIRTVESGFVSSDATFATVGTTVLAVNRQNRGNNEYRGSSVWILPAEDEDGPEPPVLQLADEQVVLAPDGSALIAGAKAAEPQGDIDWAVHRLVPTAGGGVETRRLATVEPMPARIYGLSLGSGILTRAENSTYFQPSGYYGAYRSTWLTAAGQPQPVRTTVDGLMRGEDGECHVIAGRCAVLLASGDGFHGRRDATYDNATVLYENGTSTWGPRVATGMSSPELTDLSGRFGLVDNAITPGFEDPYVVEFRKSGGGAVLERRTDRVAALWGSTLWSVAKGSPKISSKSLASGAAGPSFTTRNACVPAQLQAAGRWVYWSCDEADWGPVRGSGVYDRQTGRTMDVPGRNLGNVLLGDGYLVRQDEEAGLRLYDLHAGLPASGSAADVPQRTLASAADLGPGARARRDWTVDRFGGHVAYAGTDQQVRIVNTGVLAPPVSIIDSAVTGAATVAGGAASWQPRWWLSKPAASWTLTLTHKSTGTVVRTLTGGEARGVLAAAWDGKDDAGALAVNGSYTWKLTATPADGSGAALQEQGEMLLSGALASPYGTFAPLTPTRLMDTRSGLGVPKAKVGPGATVSLAVTGVGGVPATNVSAVVLNVTATAPTVGSFVSVYPYGTQRAAASNLNFTAGQTVPNLVVVPVKDGKVTFYNKSGSVDLLADVAGYYTAAGTGTTYAPVTPARLMDTRSGLGVRQGKVGPAGTVTLPVTEPGASAVVLNVTATGPTSASFVSVYPYGTQRAAASNLNFTAGQTVPNLVVVPVKDGKVTFYNHAGSVDLLADVAGYFKPGATGAEYRPVTPERLMDTRSGLGVPQAALGAGGTVDLKIDRPGASAVVLNVTATGPTSASFVSVYPYGTQRAAASNLNFTAGQTVPNLVVVPVKDGKVTFYNHAGSVHLIADIAGYYLN